MTCVAGVLLDHVDQHPRSVAVSPFSGGRGRATRWPRSGFAGIQFNAVVETNTAAVRLWQDLGFEIIGTVPRAFESASQGRVGLHVMYLDLSHDHRGLVE